MKSKKELTPEQYRITQQCGTEPPFSGKYNNHYQDGTYHCVCCDNPLFDSAGKFDSKSGWPSFFQALEKGNIKEQTDHSHAMTRTEVRCAACDAHLGHVFNDGPPPTRLRFCINSAALQFHPR